VERLPARADRSRGHRRSAGPAGHRVCLPRHGLARRQGSVRGQNDGRASFPPRGDSIARCHGWQTPSRHALTARHSRWTRRDVHLAHRCGVTERLPAVRLRQCARRASGGDLSSSSAVCIVARQRRLGGKCGRCEFRAVCGGSRARAYGVTGDPFAEDPACVYQPKALAKASCTVPV
jgi:hypothetical protein